MPNFIKLKVYQISIFISIIFLSHCEEEKVHSGLSALLLQPLNDGLDRREFLTDEKLKLGVDVDAGFVPTLPKDGEYSSSPGCPNPIAGYPWVWHGNDSTKCYLVGHQGPCPGHMKLFADSQSQFGYCQCDCFQDDGGPPSEHYCHKDYQSDNLDQAKFRESWTYYEKSGLCYKLFSEGPCNSGEWFVMDDTKSPPVSTCAKRRCPYPLTETYSQTVFYSAATNSCHSLGDKCHDAPEYEGFGRIESKYAFTSGSWVPTCANFEDRYPDGASFAMAAYTPITECEEGEVLSKFLNQCVKPLKLGKAIG